MDLVVLVAELSQKKHKSFRDLDKELLHLGYTSDEIEQAIAWITTQTPPMEHSDVATFDREVFRVLSPWEEMSLDPDAHGYLLRLKNLGIINEEQFERVLTRILPFGIEKVCLEDLKSLVGGIVFHVNPDDPDDEWFQAFDDEILTT